jgi:hypothetical protein
MCDVRAVGIALGGTVSAGSKNSFLKKVFKVLQQHFLNFLDFLSLSLSTLLNPRGGQTPDIFTQLMLLFPGMCVTTLKTEVSTICRTSVTAIGYATSYPGTLQF